MVLRAALMTFAALGGGFGTIRASVAFESYVLLLVGVALLAAGIMLAVGRNPEDGRSRNRNRTRRPRPTEGKRRP